MDLGDAAMLAIAQCPNQSNNVQPKLTLGQCQSAFLLRTKRLVIELALAIDAAADD
jgi:hypothetical protein